ncbi:MAG TPA: hypothetical protein VG778_02530 [Blastocatellia bacterium]|nr:hypothetical protein [Blastocatellia bacterium]
MSTESTDCYVDLWVDKHFQGSCLRLFGPAEYATLVINRTDWGDKVGSLRVGPHAFVLAYEDENFKDRVVSFGPGEAVPDLGALSFDDRMDSLNVVHSLKVFERGSEAVPRKRFVDGVPITGSENQAGRSNPSRRRKKK